MSVQRDLTCVTQMLLAPTLREATTAHVTLGTMEMDSLAIVRNETVVMKYQYNDWTNGLSIRY
ncbi:MAG: hypothetical protein A6F71_05855 [Cycloclasticus sp. symbiont of Poecilosclerida sp. M]|nr:MAG: hypothetical protein A6F71_05855 [Cycloclasticus sp. symbiont of Poecilosclerida sp. M]